MQRQKDEETLSGITKQLDIYKELYESTLAELKQIKVYCYASTVYFSRVPTQSPQKLFLLLCITS